MAIKWVSHAVVSYDARKANALIVKTLGLPVHKGSGRIAVVGGGPSINQHVDELRNWDGAIWAVNGTINWCLDHGIDAAFYTIDAQPPSNWGAPLERIKRAVVANDCSPALILKLLAQGAAVSLLPIPNSGPDMGPTSACYAAMLAAEAGYTSLTWFGCEGSFGDTESHAFESCAIDHWIGIEIAGERFATKPEFLMQSTVISEVIREFPDYYSERSGGMLRAMIEHGPDHDTIFVSEAMAATLRAA